MLKEYSIKHTINFCPLLQPLKHFTQLRFPLYLPQTCRRSEMANWDFHMHHPGSNAVIKGLLPLGPRFRVDVKWSHWPLLRWVRCLKYFTSWPQARQFLDTACLGSGFQGREDQQKSTKVGRSGVRMEGCGGDRGESEPQFLAGCKPWALTWVSCHDMDPVSWLWVLSFTARLQLSAAAGFLNHCLF